MRSVVSSLLTVATVIHFTLGCCLHPCHFGRCGEARPPSIASPADPACDHHHDAATIERDGAPCGSADAASATVDAQSCQDCDGCQGCRCVATLARPTASIPWLPWALVAVIAIDGDAIAPPGFACGGIPPDPPAHPCPSRHGLFERLLI